MNLDIECLEWTNTNRNARLVKTAKKQKQSNDSSNSIYLLQIASSKSTNSKLACLTSDQVINVYDQNNLKLLSQFKGIDDLTPNKIMTEIGFYKQNDDLIFGCSDNGTLKCWDLRLNSSKESFTHSLIFKTDDEREFLSADINALDNYFIIGTNKNIDDALIYVYDIRMSDKYLHKFAESHSNDVTQVKFDPYRGSKFCSGSLDGLVCLYDLEQQPETIAKIETEQNDDSDGEEGDSDEDEDPDLMEQVLNTDSSVHKIGYLSSDCSTKIDQLFAITFTNDLFVWDLNTHDLLFKHQSKNKNILNGTNINVNEDQEEDYFFDCFYLKSDYMAICKGDKNGNLKLLNGDCVIYDSLTEKSNEISSKRMHRDVIRSSYWNNEYFFTAGEDGFLFKWRLIDKNSKQTDYDDANLEKQSLKREHTNNDIKYNEKGNHKKSKLNKKNNNKKNKINKKKYLNNKKKLDK